MLGLGPLPAGRGARSPLLAGFAWLGASAAPRAAASPSFSGAPAHLATAVLALALLIWAAELLGTFGAVRARAVPAAWSALSGLGVVDAPPAGGGG